MIGATNRDLKERVVEGRFREDLYYRLSMIEIHLPTLAERREDLPLLQKYFVEKFSVQYRKDIKGIPRRAQQKLARHTWPGNVRELENVIGSAATMTQANTIDLADLPESVRNPTEPQKCENDLCSLEEVQNRHLQRVLEIVGGNKVRAAEVLGISRATVYEMLARRKNTLAGVKSRSALESL